MRFKTGFPFVLLSSCLIAASAQSLPTDNDQWSGRCASLIQSGGVPAPDSSGIAPARFEQLARERSSAGQHFVACNLFMAAAAGNSAAGNGQDSQTDLSMAKVEQKLALHKKLSFLEKMTRSAEVLDSMSSQAPPANQNEMYALSSMVTPSQDQYGAPPQGQYAQQPQYPPQQGQYPQQQSADPSQQGQYPPQQGQYAQQPQYPHQQGQYTPPVQAQYPPPQQSQYPQQGQYPQPQGQYTQPPGQYAPPAQGQYPTSQQGQYAPQQPQYPQQGIQVQPPGNSQQPQYPAQPAYAQQPQGYSPPQQSPQPDVYAQSQVTPQLSTAGYQEDPSLASVPARGPLTPHIVEKTIKDALYPASNDSDVAHTTLQFHSVQIAQARIAHLDLGIPDGKTFYPVLVKFTTTLKVQMSPTAQPSYEVHDISQVYNFFKDDFGNWVLKIIGSSENRDVEVQHN